MRIRRTLLAGVIAVFSIGCGTGGAGTDTPPADPGPVTMEGKDRVTSAELGHFDCKDDKPKHKLPQSIFIDATKRDLVYFPEQIGLCKNKTDLVWVAFGAKSFTVTYRPTVAVPPPHPAKLKDTVAQCYEMLDADKKHMGVSCMLNRSSHLEHGSISYNIELVTKDGVTVRIDPQLIIQK